MKNHKLYGKRILHFMNVSRFKKNVFDHETDSNWKMTLKTLEFLPMCHHYIVVPENNNIVDDRPNVTLLKYPYPQNAVTNRASFDYKSFRRLIDIKRMDIDYVFAMQPELLFNVMTALMDLRYGEIVNRMIFFHWVDCPQSRGSSAIPPSFMRQLEAINQSNTAFFHCKTAPDYLEKNFINRESSVKLDLDYIKSKVNYCPMQIDDFPESKPIELPNKKILLFNHRWNKSTGWKKMIEYTKDLSDDWMIWCTDSKAPKEYAGRHLSRAEYRYLVENSVCTISFVGGYATWNLSIQDGPMLGTPGLVYDHPTMREVLGDDYPFFFKTKDEFLNLLNVVEKNNNKKFNWDLPNHSENFKNNLIQSMEDCLKTDINCPKDAKSWIYTILNGYHYKKDITNQVQPNLMTNSVWQYIRRWLLANGVQDDPNCQFTKYSIPDDEIEKFKQLTQSVDLVLKPTTTKETIVVDKNHGFF